jgi:hypothetical protein
VSLFKLLFFALRLIKYYTTCRTNSMRKFIAVWLYYFILAVCGCINDPRGCTALCNAHYQVLVSNGIWNL